MPGLMMALLNSKWICWVIRISFAVTTMSEFFFGHPGLSPPGHAGRVRAEVVEVGDRVAVVVRVGAAVVVLPAVEVLGLVRALVGCVGDAVGVVVEVGAAVVVEVAVLVLGLEDALVARVGDAVAVGVVVRRLGASTSTNSRARASVGGLVLRTRRGRWLGHGEVRLRRCESLPLVELDGRELEVRLRAMASSRGAHRIAPFFSASSTVV